MAKFLRKPTTEPNTIKRLVINRDQCISDTSEIKLTETDFESGQESAILVRERTRRSRLEGAFKKKKGTLLEETKHTVTFLPAGKGKATIMSKREIGHDQPCCSKDADRWLQEERESLNDTAIMSETHSSGEQQTNSEAQNESNDSIQEIASFPPEQSTSAMTEQPIRSEKQTKTKKTSNRKTEGEGKNTEKETKTKQEKETTNSKQPEPRNYERSRERRRGGDDGQRKRRRAAPNKTRIRGRNYATRETAARTTRTERTKRVSCHQGDKQSKKREARTEEESAEDTKQTSTAKTSCPHGLMEHKQKTKTEVKETKKRQTNSKTNINLNFPFVSYEAWCHEVM